MTFKLGDFFPKAVINEPFLQLDDPRWAGLEGGYRGVCYDASTALRKLEQADSEIGVKEIYGELWNELHHQGDVGPASYYAAPHLVRIAKEKNMPHADVLALVSTIEIQRHKNNPPLPKALYPAYRNAIADLAVLAAGAMSKEWNLEFAAAALTAIAVAKDQLKLADAIRNLGSEDVIDEFLEDY